MILCVQQNQLYVNPNDNESAGVTIDVNQSIQDIYLSS